MNGLNGSATREILKLTVQPDMISFAGGLPAAECIPVDKITEITADILGGGNALSALQYGVTEGYMPFREELRKFLADGGVVTSSVDELFVVSGGQQGIDLTCKAFLDKGDYVLVENPTYLAFLQIASSYEATPIGVNADENGLNLADLEAKIKKYNPKFLYVVPTFSNPTGRSYSVENRKAIAALAEKYDITVLEDDPYSRLRYSGDPLPPIKSFDRAGKVLYVTSFSKILAPGLRTGVMCGDPEVIKKLVVGKQCADVHTSGLSQAIAYEYLKRGYLKPNVERSLPVYLARKTAMTAALDKYMPEEFRRTDPDGGLFIFGEFTVPIDTVKAFPEAVAKKVAYVPGKSFFVGDEGLNTIRLNYSNADEEKIERGIRALGEVFKKKVTEVK